MTIIGSAEIRIRADDKFFEPDVRKAVAKIKNLAITLRADADISRASKKIRDLRSRINNTPAIIKVDANTDKAQEKIVKLLNKFVDQEANFTAVAHTTAANTAFEELKRRYSATPIGFTAAADTKVARAQLAFAARRRTATIAVRMDPQTSAAFMGLLNTVTGTLPVEKIKSALTGVAANFEGIATKATAVVAGITAIGGVLLTTTANLFSVAGDIGQAVGIIAAIPAGLFALVTILKANKMAWEDFGDAAADNSEKANESLAKLPPNAQAAAIAMRGLKEELQQPVQNAFWEEMGTSLQNMIDNQFDSVVRGMSMIGSALGVVTAEFFNTVAGLGDFNDVFDNVATGLRNMVSGIEPAIQGLATFIGVGSQRLPMFGTWLSDIGEKFGDFARRAEQSGDILRWIDTGTQRLQELGSIVVSTTSIFNGLADAARLSGAPGLTEFADGFRNVADIVNGEPFKSRLVTVLEGARRGTDKLADGFGTLTDFIGRSSGAIGIFLDEAGEIAGLTFESITTLFDGTGLGSGLYLALDGLKQALVILEPGFRNFGTVIGDLGEIAQELFINMAPGLNQLADTLEGIVAGLKDGIIAAMPVFNEFIQSVLLLVQGPLVSLANGVGNVLEAFAGLPPIIQTAISSVGLFLLLRGKIATFGAGLGALLASPFARVVTDSKGAVVGVTRFGAAFTDTTNRINSAWGNVGRTFAGTNGTITSAVGPLGRLRDGAGATARAIGTSAGQGLRLAGSGLMSMLGGPWGAALAVAAVGIGIFAAEQAEAKAKVDNLADSLNQQTGAFTNASRKITAADILDLDATAMDDFFRGFNMNMEEIVDVAGINLDRVTKILSNPEGRDAFVSNWNQIADAIMSGKGITDEMAESVGMVKSQFDNLSGGEVSEIARQFEAAAETAKKAEAQIQALADATGTSTVEAAKLATNMGTLSDATSTVSAKAAALRENIDILGGGMMTARTAARDQATAMFALDDSLKSLAESNETTISSTGELTEAFRNSLLEADGSFSNASRASIEFSKTMDTAAQAVLTSGAAELQRMLDLNKSFPEAAASALDVMSGSADQIRQTLLDAGYEVEVVNGLMSELGIDDSQLTGAVSIDTLEAEAAIVRVGILAAALAEGNYEVALSAMTDSAKTKIMEVEAIAEAYAEGGWEAVIGVIDESGPGIEDFLLGMATAQTAEDVQKVLNAEFAGELEVEKATGSLKDFNDTETPGKELDVNFRGSAAVYTATKDIDDYNEKVVPSKELNAEFRGAAEAAAAKTGIDTFNNTTPASKELDANFRGRSAVVEAIQSVEGFGVLTPQATLDVLNNTGGGIGEATGSVSIFDALVGTAGLQAANETATGKAAADSVVGIFDRSIGTAGLQAANETATGKASADGSVSVFDRSVGIAGLQAANETARGVGSANGSVLVFDRSTGTASLFALNSTFLGVQAANNTIAGVNDKTAVINVITRYTTEGNRPASLGPGGRGGPTAANGGIMRNSNPWAGKFPLGPVAAFADGGIMKNAVKAFAGGGVENHTAQIARGAWPVRIWAEPETGGEAYLPLAKGKRKRSLEILAEVMKEFGLGHLAQFADGGMMRSAQVTPAIVNSRYAASYESATPAKATPYSGGGDNRPVIVVNPSQGLSEEQIGIAASDHLFFRAQHYIN